MKILNFNLENFSLCLLIIILLSACAKKEIPQTIVEEKKEQKLEVKEKPLQYPEEKFIDLLHTKLNISFDWENQTVKGKADLRIRPLANKSVNAFTLDAKMMTIDSIIVLNSSKRLGFEYSYDKLKIDFSFGDELIADQIYDIQIFYLANPNNYVDPIAPENRGLFFIDPLDTIPGLMPQIWTQGEAEYSSVWFPTIDRPDEKFTQEIYLTVDTAYQTLSNGVLVTRTFNEDNTRTDYWHLDKPHPAYLSMVAVGDWEIIDLESDLNFPINVYAEKEFSSSLKHVFQNTSEMISFFQDTLDFEYPWKKYSQIPVRRFVTGAMENTSASVFMENLMVDSKYLADEHFDGIIAHELFHQWFGDVVTCRSWTYITLNEAFANYSEYLWADHFYGEEEAGLIRIQELSSYYREAEDDKHPIVRNRYDHPDELFDSHTYAKGGLVLHMLRNELGDKQFFLGVQKYLKKYAFKNVELSDLRKVFEEVSGKNLELFFDQWFMSAGHPVLKVYEKDTLGKKFLFLEQTQEERVFQFPLTIRNIESNGESRDASFIVDKRVFRYDISNFKRGGTIIIDPQNSILAEIDIDYNYEDLLLHYKYSEEFLNRYYAFETLIDDYKARILGSGLSSLFIEDESNTIREMTLNFIEDEFEALPEELRKTTINLAENDEKSYVRGAAISALSTLGYTDTTFYAKFLNDTSWFVNARAIEALMEYKESKKDLDSIVDMFSSSNNPHIANLVADHYSLNDRSDIDWFDLKMLELIHDDKYAILGYYGLELEKSDPERQKQGIKYLFDIAVNDEYSYNRFMAFQSLIVFAERPEVKTMLIEVLDREDAQDLKRWIQSML